MPLPIWANGILCVLWRAVDARLDTSISYNGIKLVGTAMATARTL